MSRLIPILLLLASVACATREGAGTTDAGPTAAEAAAFVRAAEEELYEVGVRSSRAAWVRSTYITHDTNVLSAEASEAATAARVARAHEAARFLAVDLDPETARKIEILRTAITLPAPRDPEKNAELARIETELESAYGAGKWCPPGGECLDLGEMERIMATSRDPDSLLAVWRGWRTVSPPMRDDYARMVELANEGARELGFADVGAMWRSGYDMPPEAFAAEVDRLWEQVRPLYEALHCHVRAELAERYGSEVVPPDGPIPAHLLGNMWAQSWANVYPLVAPEEVDPGYDLTAVLEERGVDGREMVRYGEAFFVSLGLDPLPETFWDRSLFERPADRDVVCHPSAWDVDQRDDVRIKMCIRPTAEDFQTIHHELGHNYYQMAYRDRPLLFRGSAHDGFHEALGDLVGLSVTPGYLVDVGLLEAEPEPSKDLGLLLREALDKVAFLPFGLLVDRWRWSVFSGELPPSEYNAGWWELRRRYQGVAPPVPRSEADFDPGAKFHIPGNTPYTRYFLARILQFQFHRALCEAIGYDGPLHRCSIHGSEEAGRRLAEMMAMGRSRPWPDALEALTGQREMDATAILDYFAPLEPWLAERNEGRTCGW